MNKYRRQNTFYCFSPGVMLATFIIEVAYIVYILLRYKLTLITKLAILLLASLATFQLAEYFICEQPALGSEVWARLGFVSITALLPLGIHLVYALAGRSMNYIVRLSYAMAAIWMVFLALTPDLFDYFGCGGNYSIFHIKGDIGGAYFLYYYFWLYVGALLSLRFIFKAGKKQKAVKQSLGLFMIAYLALLVPTTIVNTIKPESAEGIPSIMCGFALIMATIVTFGIVPRLGKPKKSQK